MRDRVWSLVGLAVFVVVLTAPFWCARAGANPSARLPNLQLPATQKECIAPAGTMRAVHMQLLVNWREDVVRRGDRKYIAYDGKVYEKSLTHTCMGCHSKAGFCDRCHAYSGVSAPYCWNCHNEPQTTIGRSTP
jgi:hypothetical protein